MKYVRIPRDRLVEWLNTISVVDDYTHKIVEKLGKLTAILHGSHARGDFNIWSDIDLIILSEKFGGIRVLDRYELINPTPPRLEPIPLTPSEFINNIQKHVWRHALKRGAVILIDQYDIVGLLKNLGINILTKKQLVNKIERLLRENASNR